MKTEVATDLKFFIQLDFQTGRRRCVGEDFGKTMLAVFVVKLVQTFNIHFTSEVKKLLAHYITVFSAFRLGSSAPGRSANSFLGSLILCISVFEPTVNPIKQKIL